MELLIILVHYILDIILLIVKIKILKNGIYMMIQKLKKLKKKILLVVKHMFYFIIKIA